MRKTLNFNKLIIAVVILAAPVLLSWGAIGHEHINRAAVMDLPQPLQTFFFNHVDFITQESTVPDLRRNVLSSKDEDPRHYIDLENFGPEDSLPATLAEVKAKYSDEFLQKNGILPWYIEDMMNKLTKAFKEKRKTEILFIAADLGHYIADAHTPLHTTVNYDGQLTDQKGVHSLWETRCVKLFYDKYNYNPGKAVYIDNIHNQIWKIINSSHSLADTVLKADKELRKQLPSDLIYEKDSLGNIKKMYNSPVYSDAYAAKFHERLHGMIENQMRASIQMVAGFWYTAWVNAGKPDLSDLDPAKQTSRNKKQLRNEQKEFNKGKLVDLK